jgi:hypothetical protein
MTNQMLACSDCWLDGGNTALPLTTYQLPNYSLGQINYWPYAGYYPVYVSSPARPIKLLLSEIEQLRKAAKNDSRLKAILQKFTTQIEIAVDFE